MRIHWTAGLPVALLILLGLLSVSTGQSALLSAALFACAAVAMFALLAWSYWQKRTIRPTEPMPEPVVED
ncbi:hypothetical protein [Bifidobacterium choloepi]|uniref:Uncharacterized protein n=1 Tax=Bifidobacterium choloepi TaxID=2614131 RepID=A0A6I5MY66_9BIFI|nr:hypothetical protein [Bifidobacterium choloepi]NEG69207.1 hypothetical protein [Bifidobacterium choloepi]